MNATLKNGQVRKSLAEQIDRLDTLLDGLAEGLNAAVALAVKEAVRSVLAELLANADLQAQLQSLRPAPKPGPSVIPNPTPSRVRRLIGRLGQWLGTGLKTSCLVVCSAAGSVVSTVQTGLSSFGRGCQHIRHSLTTACGTVVAKVCVLASRTWQTVRLLRHVAGSVLLASVVGVLLALVTFHAGPWLAALASGISGFTVALTVQLMVWLRRTMGGWPGPSQVA
jgi:hypothetical protein